MATDAARHTWWKATPSHLLAVLAVGLALALVLTVLLPTPTADAATGCSVKNQASGRVYRTLQAAANAARPKVRLLVRGTCRGTTVIRKNLTIIGLRSKRSGPPKLSGSGKVRVLEIEKGARARIRSLKVVQGKVLVRGRGASGRTGVGGGIHNRGRLVLRDVQVLRNRAGEYGSGHGGGVHNKGTLILNGSTLIAGNYSPSGGGVSNEGTLVMNDRSSISRNGGEYDGGLSNEGVVVMNDRSSISRNGGEGPGGAFNSGRFTMNDASTISRNGAWEGPGGVLNWRKGTFTMNDRSSIRGNNGTDGGGGGLANRGGTVTMRGQSLISGNFATVGGGVRNANDGGRRGTFTMRGQSSIRGNEAERWGGGVVVEGGVFRMEGASRVAENRAPRRLSDVNGTLGGGGGIYLAGGSLVGVWCAPVTLANVYANAHDDCYFEE